MEKQTSSLLQVFSEHHFLSLACFDHFFLVNMEVSCYSLNKGVTPELRFVSSSLGLVILLRL